MNRHVRYTGGAPVIEVAVASLGELHQHIRELIAAGESGEPRSLCRTILRARPDNLETLLLLAEIQLEAGETRAAMAGFERVIASDPEGYLGCAGLAIASEACNDTAAAAHWFGRASELNPMNRELRAERDRLFGIAYPGVELPPSLSAFATARAMLSSGLARDAASILRRALEREPGRLEIQVGLAEALWITAQVEDATQQCAALLCMAPRAVKAHALMAAMLADDGDLPGAEPHLEEVLRQDPEGRIAGHLLRRSVLAPRATAAVLIELPVASSAAADAERHEPPLWSKWMREALWRVLGLASASSDSVDSFVDMPAAPRLGSGPLGRRLAGNSGQEETAGEPSASSSSAGSSEDAMVSEEIIHVRAAVVARAASQMRAQDAGCDSSEIPDNTEIIEKPSWTPPWGHGQKIEE